MKDLSLKFFEEPSDASDLFAGEIRKVLFLSAFFNFNFGVFLNNYLIVLYQLEE